jgi:hypothetical protein
MGDIAPSFGGGKIAWESRFGALRGQSGSPKAVRIERSVGGRGVTVATLVRGFLEKEHGDHQSIGSTKHYSPRGPCWPWLWRLP